MMMCHPTKFGCKKISSSINIYIGNSHIFDYMSPHCDPELENSKSISLHSTLAHGASPYQVWLQKDQRLRRYRWVEQSLEFLTFPVTLTLTTTEQSNLFARQSSSWLGAIKPNYFSCERISNSENILKSHLWWHDPPLWPWSWRQQTNIFRRQFGSCWCTTVPSLVV